VERRLAVILAADVVDYTRLMGADDAGTLAALNELRTAVFQPQLETHSGSVIKRMGDGWLVEFANVANAVACAITIQEALSEHAIIRLRMGIHIGDVTFQEDDIYGDGINVAARLEALADPGQVLISDLVHHSLDTKTAGQFSGGAAMELKNVSRPVQIWRWPEDVVVNATDIVALPAAGLPPPDKPSIAVLPFTNMSGNPENEYFSDGLSEDIITGLSLNRWLFVIARNSSFAYKESPTDIRRIGEELGVRYVLEGSVRRSGARVRVNAQLIEAASGNHIWARRYDRKLEDVFELQDELTQDISANVQSELTNVEQEQARKKPTSNLDAWDCYLRAMWHFQRPTKADQKNARDFFKLAISKDESFARAHAGLAQMAATAVTVGHADDPVATLQWGLRYAETALELDRRDLDVQAIFAFLKMLSGDAARAIEMLQKVVSQSENSSQSLMFLGAALYWNGEAGQAIQYFQKSLRLNPTDRRSDVLYFMIGISHYQLKDNEEALRFMDISLQHGGKYIWTHIGRIIALAQLDRLGEAKSALSSLLARRPDFSCNWVRTAISNVPGTYVEHIVTGLRKAGLPED